MNSGPHGAWPMFLFGFLDILVITQMHGLGLRTRTRTRTRWILLAGYAAAAVGVYSWRGLDRITEIVRIPMIEYLLVGVLVLLIWPVALLARRRSPARDEAVPVDHR